MKRPKATLATVRRLALALPGVAEGLSYGTPGFRVRNKFMAPITISVILQSSCASPA